MRNSKFVSTLVSVALLLTSSTAFAGYTCSGKVSGVAMELDNGDVFAESIGAVSWPRLCNMHVAANGIPPDVCKSIYATLLSAQATGKSVTFWVNDTATTCQTLVAWQYVNGLYFIRVDG